MEKRFLILLLFVLIFSSCNVVSSYYLTFKGKYSFDAGEYQKANLEYIRAQSSGFMKEWHSYNLANVYYALGETVPAKEEWENAEESLNTYLISKVYYNEGVYYYEKGDYEKAYGFFKKALKITPSDINTKINLELSLKKMNSDKKKKNKTSQDAQESKPLSNEARRVLDYVKRREINKWASNRKSLKSDIKNDW